MTTRKHVTQKRTKPSPRECALLTLHLLARREEKRERPVTRARFSVVTLQRLWLRHEITRDLIADVNECTLDAGWAIFFCGGSYAAIRVEVAETWLTVASKSILDDLQKVAIGAFDFDSLEHLLLVEPRERAPGAEKREDD